MPTTTFRTVNGRILGHNKAGVASEYLLDPLGSVIGTSTSAGVVSNRTTYWPYGEVRTGGVSSVTPFGFCGGWGYYTDSSGSLYVRARYYRSSLTRWQTVDPLWPNESAYGYVVGRAIDGVDPLGQMAPIDPMIFFAPPITPPSVDLENLLSCGCKKKVHPCLKASSAFGFSKKYDSTNALGHCMTACCIKRRNPECVWYWNIRELASAVDPGTCMDDWNNKVGYGCAYGSASCYACCLNKIGDLTWIVPIRHNFPPPGGCGSGAGGSGGGGGTGPGLSGGNQIRGGTSQIWH
jgi:RHS repeat-associated protein